MKHLVKASLLAAAAIVASASAEAATRVYTGSCQIQCSFQKVAGTVTSVRIEYTPSVGYTLVGSADPSYGDVTTYRATSQGNVYGGRAFTTTTTGTFTGQIGYAGVNLDINQLITSDLSYYEGDGLFTAGASFDTAFSTISGRPIEQVIGVGSPAAAPIRITIDFDAAPEVPEPSTWALMLAGFGMVGYAMRRRVAKSFLTPLV